MKRDPSGYWKMLGIKGESAGHPFRGNQYREGEAGGATPQEQERTLLPGEQSAFEFAAEPARMQELKANARNACRDFAFSGHGNAELVHVIKNDGGLEIIEGTEAYKTEVPDEVVAEATEIVHTHPNGSSFSDGDLKIFADWPNLFAIEAVGPRGEVFRLEKTPEFNTTPREMLRIYKMIERQLLPAFQDRGRALFGMWGQLDELFKQHTDDIIKAVVMKVKGLKYSYVEIPPKEGIAPPRKTTKAKGKVTVIDDSSIRTPTQEEYKEMLGK